jgi:hypothetical protein
MGHTSRPGGASHLQGPRHGDRRTALQRRAWLYRREHTTGPAGPATWARLSPRPRGGLRGALPAGRARVPQGAACRACSPGTPGAGCPGAGRTSPLPMAMRKQRVLQFVVTVRNIRRALRAQLWCSTSCAGNTFVHAPPCPEWPDRHGQPGRIANGSPEGPRLPALPAGIRTLRQPLGLGIAPRWA